MKIKLYFTAAVVALGLSATAQNQVDALRYANLSTGGSARYVGMSGAWGAVGSNGSALSGNPAGIAFYRTSEFSFSSALYTGKTSSAYLWKTRDDKKYNFNIPSFSIVMAGQPQNALDKEGWRFYQFGFGINRLANYNNRMNIEGMNYQNSILTPMANEANAPGFLEGSSPYGADMAIKSNLLFYDDEQGRYLYDMEGALSEGKGMLQVRDVTTSGYLNEVAFTGGANYNDKIFLGVTIGLPYIRFEQDVRHTEEDIENYNPYFNKLEYKEHLETTGDGVNVKLGVIVRPTDWLRIGGALHSPTWFYKMEDKWYNSMESWLTDVDNSGLTGGYNRSPDGNYEYELETPMRAQANVAFLFGGYGLFSADYEYIDYGASRLRANDYNFNNENDAITNEYSAAHNVRLGTEWRYGALSVRGGWAWNGSAYKGSKFDDGRMQYSGGVGFRWGSYSLDGAWVHSSGDSYYSMYPGALFVKNRETYNNLVVSFGYRF